MIRSVSIRRILRVGLFITALSLLVGAEPYTVYADTIATDPIETRVDPAAKIGSVEAGDAVVKAPQVPMKLPVVPPKSSASTFVKAQTAPASIKQSTTRALSSPHVLTTPSTEVDTPATTPPLIISAFNTSTQFDFFELYNQSDYPIDLATVTIAAYDDSSLQTIACRAQSSAKGWLLADHYITLGASGDFTHQLTTSCSSSTEIHALGLFVRGQRVQLINNIRWQSDTSSWAGHTGMFYVSGSREGSRKSVSTVKQTGTFSDYTEFATSAELLDSGTLYSPPGSSDLKIVEIFPDARSCLPGDTSGDCFDFIKLKNTSNHTIDLAQFRLRVGSRDANASVTTSYTWQEPTLNPERDELLLPAGQQFLLRLRNDGQPLSLSNADGNVWIEDYYGIQSYDAVSYNGMDKAAASDKSWILDEDSHSWQFGIPSPFGSNRLFVGQPGQGAAGGKNSDLKPCRADQYRSTETNRCRNKMSNANSLVPCRAGQYRSEETNRCRSTTSAANTLKPCASNQIRSLETNRCRKVAVASSSLTPCAKGKERNPETNRCRKIVTNAPSNTAFAPEPIKQSAKSFIGWWALGGITLFAAGYGAWEWRQELRRGIAKVAQIFSSKQ